MNKGKFISGIVLLFLGIWGGSFLMTVFPANSSYGFAAFITGFAFTLSGIFLTILGIDPRT